MFKYFNCFLIIFFTNSVGYSSELLTMPVVKTENGIMEGTYYKTFNGRTVNAFLGVPFSIPPIGDHRFEPPVPANSWKGVYYANKTKSPCLQFNHYLFSKNLNPIVGSEDCLYLNLYTPKILNENLNETLMNVIVFIHGGSFMYGKSDSFYPKYLLDENDFVFITIPYRVGPFGFLSTEDYVVPGNNGLKDQVMALKWINKNIKLFGGDPLKVTIAGFSAGGASVHLHYLSQMSKNLFHKGISLSGTSLCPWAYMEEPKQRTIKLAESLNCPTNNTQLLVDCLKELPGHIILSKIKPLFLGWLYNPISPFGPTAEVTNSLQFLSDHPYKLLKEGKIHDLPWLVGFTTDEGLYPAAEFISDKILMNELSNTFLKTLPYILDYNMTLKSKRDRISEKIKNYYLKGNSSTILSKKGRNSLIQMISDRMYINAIDKSIKLQSLKTKSSIYLYNFAYRGKYSFSDMFTGVRKNFGVSHGDDTAYVLGSYFSCTDNKNDSLMVKTMVNIWSSFITNGAPAITNSDINNNNSDYWQPVRESSFIDGSVKFLVIKSNEIQMSNSKNLGNNLFWNSLNSSEFNYDLL